jgi:N-acetylglutamate synthase-like GNAT family acetyltransferase
LRWETDAGSFVTLTKRPAVVKGLERLGPVVSAEIRGFVHPGERDRKVFSRLMETAVREAADHGVERVFGVVEPESPASAPKVVYTFRKLGFEQARENFWVKPLSKRVVDALKQRG